MDLQLAGRTAVVTGGSKGIGLAVVRTLLDEGMRVVTGSRSITAELAATAAVPVAVDLSTPDGPTRLIEEAFAELGGIDVLVDVGVGDTGDSAPGATNTVLTLPSLVSRGGVIVDVSSIGARLAGVGPADHTVSEAALRALTKVLAEQFGSQGVRAISISPGPVSTGVWPAPDGFIGRLARARGMAHDAFAEQVPDSLGVSTERTSTPEEVARLIAFAASPNTVTGAAHLVDGGLVKSA